MNAQRENIISMPEAKERVKPVPMYPEEMTPIKQAAFLAMAGEEYIRRACIKYGIGIQFEKHCTWRVSRPALFMWVNKDWQALEAFRRGDRTDPRVTKYLSM